MFFKKKKVTFDKVAKFTYIISAQREFFKLLFKNSLCAEMI